jgi:hypothetical protein
LTFRSPPERRSGSRRAEVSPPGCLPCGLFPFGVFPRVSSHLPQVSGPGFRYLLSVSHALKVLIRSLSAGLVSCRSRPWGFPSGPISTCRAVQPFGCHTLLWLVRRPPLQGFVPCKCLSSSRQHNPDPEDSDPHGIRLLRDFTLSCRGWGHQPSSHGLLPVNVRSLTCPTEYCLQKKLA